MEDTQDTLEDVQDRFKGAEDIIEEVSYAAEDMQDTLEDVQDKFKGVEDILNTDSMLLKNIMLNYTVDTSNTGEKVSQVERFKQKKHKNLRAYKFNNNHRYGSKARGLVENLTNTEKFNKYNLYASAKNNKC